MSEEPDQVEKLDGLDTGILNRKGWHFVTYFQTRQEAEGSSAEGKAYKKALEHKRKAGIRKFVKDGTTYWEIWEHW